MANALTEKSKYLSYLLRHKPEAAGLHLDKEGWCDIDTILRNTDLTEEEIHQIVLEDKKGRYSISPGGVNIRANQGHSTSEVKLTFNRAIPPTILYHGTNGDAKSTILKEGLKPMSRHHVHLSPDLETARNVGGRRKGGLTVFVVDAKQMLADGLEFFLSDNGVWLVPFVDRKYLTIALKEFQV